MAMHRYAQRRGFLGGMLGIASALILELSQRRIRSAEDLSITIDLPVLAELARMTKAD